MSAMTAGLVKLLREVSMESFDDSGAWLAYDGRDRSKAATAVDVTPTGKRPTRRVRPRALTCCPHAALTRAGLC